MGMYFFKKFTYGENEVNGYNGNLETKVISFIEVVCHPIDLEFKNLYSVAM